MTRKEIAKVLSTIKTAYPRFYKDVPKEEALETVDLWQKIFSEYLCSDVEEAVYSLITKLEYPPTIAEVKKFIDSKKNAEIFLANCKKEAEEEERAIEEQKKLHRLEAQKERAFKERLKLVDTHKYVENIRKIIAKGVEH